ncbi:double-strand break repair protein AddB [Brevundimonas sp. 2R-24]|uniref:Double-strand break repair protein AddB n=1 Tax=Peiella sedimenti TaxID=3061083 RepID=A0ABT8SKT6_9CAUL|nr:double-strand break repair protein AddB [Caulobacteraceae bacterium XZ-24]
MTQSPFAEAGPRWFTIPAHRPFFEDLARALRPALGGESPEAAAQAVILTPTRRAGRDLAEAWLRGEGPRAAVLPQIRPLGDLEEGEPPFEPSDLALDLPAALSPLRRRFELARLCAEHAHLLKRELDAAAALDMAEALGGLIDSALLEEVELQGRLEGLVAADLAEHWRRARAFLEAALNAWPGRLKALGLIDPAARRVLLLNRLAESWEARPPQTPLVIAGSTGTAPATARVMRAAAEAPMGCVVLPGLDQSLSDPAWAEVDVQHPQGALKRLLARFGLTRGQVKVWPGSRPDPAGEARDRLINEALRPARATADWVTELKEFARTGRDPVARGLQGLTVHAAPDDEKAAETCALLVREALKTPERTCAVVTPDQALARRIALKLERWGVGPDVSAGRPLSLSATGTLARLMVEAAADPADPVALLALLKHPLARLDGAEALDLLEEKALRGPRARTPDDLARRLTAYPTARDLLDELQAKIAASRAPFANGLAAADEAARGLAQALEALAGLEVWGGADGEALATLLAELMDQGAALPPVSVRDFARLIPRLTGQESLRHGGNHPRVRILGAVEARLYRADRMILCGLEEGVWPAHPPIDPFLSRPMRERLGLPSPERRVGLTAHDFVQAACAPEVILVHSERRGGQPAQLSRWLWRLRMLARGVGVELPVRPELAAWTEVLDAPGPWTPCSRPAPRPPVEHRPRDWFVTQVETLTRDPYAVWAGKILGLRQKPRPDEAVDARLRGTAVHKAFEDFAESLNRGEAPDPAAFETLYMQALRDGGLGAAALAREQALAAETARWAAGFEMERRAEGARVLVERKGTMPVSVSGEAFTLSAKADRLEAAQDGRVHVLDFKTGSPPSAKQVAAGFAPQLTLTAAIVEAGGFEGLAHRTAGDLAYVRVTGRNPPGEVKLATESRGVVTPSDEAGAAALDGFIKLMSVYLNPETAYVSRLAPEHVRDGGDYDHLARVREWSAGEAEAEGGGAE